MKTFFTPWTVVLYFMILMFSVTTIIYSITGTAHAYTSVGVTAGMIVLIGCGWFITKMLVKD